MLDVPSAFASAHTTWNSITTCMSLLGWKFLLPSTESARGDTAT